MKLIVYRFTVHSDWCEHVHWYTQIIDQSMTTGLQSQNPFWVFDLFSIYISFKNNSVQNYFRKRGGRYQRENQDFEKNFEVKDKPTKYRQKLIKPKNDDKTKGSLQQHSKCWIQLSTRINVFEARIRLFLCPFSLYSKN